MRGCVRVLGGVLVALASAFPVWAQSVNMVLDDVLSFEDGDVAYRLDLTLGAVAPTRIKVDALLDLTAYQADLPDLLDGYRVVDSCESETDLRDVVLRVEGAEAFLTGQISTQNFTCERVGDRGFERTETLDAGVFTFSARATGGVVENCFVAELIDLQFMLDSGLAPIEFSPRTQVLLLGAANAVLAELPLCLDLPPELASLDPIYETVGLEEIWDGGFGLRLRGTADVSTTTILAVMSVLQTEGVLPGPPQ